MSVARGLPAQGVLTKHVPPPTKSPGNKQTQTATAENNSDTNHKIHILVRISKNVLDIA